MKKDTFITQDITHKVKSFEDACKILKLNPKHIPDVKNISIRYKKQIIASYKLMVIVTALNERWEPYWYHSVQKKYCPFLMWDDVSRCVFIDRVCDCTDDYARVGSRFVFKTPELATYAGKQFIDLYNDYLTI